MKRWDVADGRASPSVDRKPAPVVAMACVRSRAWLLTGLISMATRCLVIELEAGDPAVTVATIGMADSFTNLTLSNDERLLAAGGRDGVTRIDDFEAAAQALDRQHHLKTLPPMIELSGHKKPIASVGFFPDTRRAVTAAMDSHVIVWDLQTGKTELSLKGASEEQFAGVAVVGGGSTIVGALADGRLRIWEEA